MKKPTPIVIEDTPEARKAIEQVFEETTQRHQAFFDIIKGRLPDLGLSPDVEEEFKNAAESMIKRFGK